MRRGADVEVVELRGGEDGEDGEDRLSVDRIDYLKASGWSVQLNSFLLTCSDSCIMYDSILVL